MVAILVSEPVVHRPAIELPSGRIEWPCCGVLAHRDGLESGTLETPHATCPGPWRRFPELQSEPTVDECGGCGLQEGHEQLMDHGVIPDTRPPVRIPRRRRLRWWVQVQREWLGEWIGGRRFDDSEDDR